MTARVLVVDDVERNVKLLEAKLSAEYFDVVTAMSGTEALDRMKSALPDIVLLDVMMPEMDGFEVCRRIRETPQTLHVPVIMVTALSDVADKVRGLEAGADDFLTKPVDDLALFARVRSLVRLKMANDELRLRLETSRRLGVVDAQPIAMQNAGDADVLVVEASQLAGRRIVEVLESDGNRVQVARSANDALNQAASQQFDLILVSMDLGEDDPLRLCSQLRNGEETRATPMVAIIDDDDKERFAKVLELGVADCLTKPIEKSELLARARTQIRRRRYLEHLRQDFERGIAMALTDPLTGCHNRRYLDTHLNGQVEHSRETGKTLSLLMLDIDYFKAINDTHGHVAGDEVLREIAQRIGAETRGFDMLARYGGEEFVVVMPDAGPRVTPVVAERLRRAVADRPFETDAAAINVTISIGAAHTTQVDDAGALLQLADEALYAAKAKGRNRWVDAADMTPAAQMSGAAG